MWQLAVVRDSKGVVRRSMEVEEELQVFTGMKSNPLFDHLQNTRIMFCPLKDEVYYLPERNISHRGWSHYNSKMAKICHFFSSRYY